MIIEDLQELFIDLNQKKTCKRIGYSFGKERKWVVTRKYSNSFTITPEFVAGLNEYGYELKLVKKNANSKTNNL